MNTKTYSEKLTRRHLYDLKAGLALDAVLEGAAIAMLNVAVELVPTAKVSAYLRKLADAIDADAENPADVRVLH